MSRLPFLLQVFPGLVLGIGILFLPFSPRWLASKGRDREALSSLAKLRMLSSTDKRVESEWYDIRAEVALQKEISAERHPALQDGSRQSRLKLEIAAWADCFKPGCWRRTHVGVGIMFFQQFVGINALIYYSPTLFGTMGLNHSMQLIMSGVLNIMQLVGVSTSIWTMDFFGRRPLLLCGSAAMFVSHVIIAGLVGRYSDNWPAHRSQGWTAVGFLLFYMISFGASYVFFAVFCLLSLLWTWFFVPETMGRCVIVDRPPWGQFDRPLTLMPATHRTLEQMDEVFKDATAADDEQKRDRIERAIAMRASEDGTR
ncbi:hypothetical protein LTR53_009034 [Teratosphaeriaceae sp. CCFEE 6253]|nr:hypothetical protein LTR53_009034 [Teratosphaeriaceae sp. CCFEE 6253]